MKGRCYPFVLLAVWGALGKPGLGARTPDLERRSDDVSSSNSSSNNGSGIPTAHDFIRRGCHTVAVLGGDYLYVDGGQITERVNDSAPADSPSYDGMSSPSLHPYG